MRSLWNGTLSFGLVTIPVKLYAATSKKDVSLRMLHDLCHTPLRYQRMCPHCERAVTPDETVSGFETEKDRFVILSEDDLERLPTPAARTVAIEHFVPAAAVDPVYFEKTYYLEPDTGGGNAYQLLRTALTDAGQYGIGRIAIRSRESLCAVRPGGGDVLTLSLLFFADEVRSPARLDLGPPDWQARPEELQAALTLMESMSRDWDPSRYENRRHAALQELVRDRQAIGAEPAYGQPEAAAEVLSLMEALRASVADRERAADDRQH